MNHDPVTRLLSLSAVALLTFIVVWLIIATVRGPSIEDRLIHLDHQVNLIACLIVLPVEERAEAAVTDCLIPDGVDSPP